MTDVLSNSAWLYAVRWGNGQLTGSPGRQVRRSSCYAAVSSWADDFLGISAVGGLRGEHAGGFFSGAQLPWIWTNPRPSFTRSTLDNRDQVPGATLTEHGCHEKNAKTARPIEGHLRRKARVIVSATMSRIWATHGNGADDPRS